MEAIPNHCVVGKLQTNVKGVKMNSLYEVFKLVKLMTDRACIRRCYFTTENMRYCTDSTEMYLLKEG